MGKTPAPDWLAVDDILAMFHSQRGPARRAYARVVTDGIGAADPNEEIHRAGILGSEAFMERVLDLVGRQALGPEIIRKARPALWLEAIAQRHQTRDPAIHDAYSTAAYRTTEIVEFFSIHRSTASGINRGRELFLISFRRVHVTRPDADFTRIRS